jgi:hypothetical protein
VFDEDLDKKEIKPFALCPDCHQLIPEDIAKEYSVKQVKRCKFGLGG